MRRIWNSIQANLGDTIPEILAAMAIILVGWIIAVVIRAGVIKGLGVVNLNEKIHRRTDFADSWNLEKGLGIAAFWLVMLFVVVAALNTMNLTAVSGPLQGMATDILEFIPNLISALVLAALAFVVASVVKTVIEKGLAATTLDDKITREANMQPMSATVGTIAFWLLLLVFVPAILGALEINGVLAPVRGMVDQVLSMLPRVLGAVLIGAVGWFVAKLLREITENVLAAVGFDRLGTRVGLEANVRPSSLAGLLVFIFVFIPTLIAALNVLRIEVISGPATDMLHTFMAAIPNIFAAIIILTVAIVLARFVSGLIRDLLAGAGADQLPAKMGLGDFGQAVDTGEANATSSFTVSKFVGQIVAFFIILFAAVEASERLGFDQLADLAAMFIEFAGQIVLGSVILLVGFWLANFAHRTILAMGGKQAELGATVARIAIIVLVSAMGLRAMGIADGIVDLAFTLILGSVAVAIALAFGLGGRDAAGRQLEHWLSRLRG